MVQINFGFWTTIFWPKLLIYDWKFGRPFTCDIGMHGSSQIPKISWCKSTLDFWTTIFWPKLLIYDCKYGCPFTCNMGMHGSSQILKIGWCKGGSWGQWVHFVTFFLCLDNILKQFWNKVHLKSIVKIGSILPAVPSQMYPDM